MLGRGGIAAVSRASGISPNTIQKGMREIESGERLTRGRMCVGLVVGAIRSAKPIRSWLWRSSDWSRRTVVAIRCRCCCGRRGACGSSRSSCVSLASTFTSRRSLTCCARLGYSLRSNRKRLEGSQHPDRDRPFRLINERVAAAIMAGSRRFGSTPRRKGSSASSRTPAGSGGRRATRSSLHPRLSQSGRRQGDPLRRV